ncbi:transcriptional regulator [Embleya sp. NPDC020630]|uniref:transcriptional regulator n=1 Tax=Embleya sp. NPDC020630 TaxID=3363979 RepID=UPI0037BBA598
MTTDVTPAALPRHVLDREDVRRALRDHDFGTVFRLARKYGGISYQKIADACDIKAERVGTLARGEGRVTTVEKMRSIADALRVPGAMIGIAPRDWESAPGSAAGAPETSVTDDELDAVELGRRAAASDVGEETLNRLESAFDELAVDYARLPPRDLLVRTRRYLSYASHLFAARKTLAEHRRLVTVAGRLSLIGATLQIDLGRHEAATAGLRTAVDLARQADRPELEAWCHETDAWRALVRGDHRRCLELSRAAKALAPKGSSVAIQATAQEGRAHARLGLPRETYASIARVHAFVSRLPPTDRPEHHYHYDPDKSTSYTATTLSWLGDPAAEDYAREVIARLTPTPDTKMTRRAAVAHLDLALILLTHERLDEACATAHRAIRSGRVAPSSHWRALEVVKAVEARGLPEAAELGAAYEELKRPRAEAT